ncbi:MAG TPA: hypothetical protein VGU66_13845 [Candidatus Elarobacter sp.]|nr:hypothetical protein [Candidatus Elarobacter sp.]
MPDVRVMAAAYGVRVELADLGDWASVTLVAEYDPDGPVIRVNERALWRTLRQAQGDNTAQGDEPWRDAIDRAIAHELYHHREAVGEIVRIADRAARERAADAFADALVRAR